MDLGPHTVDQEVVFAAAPVLRPGELRIPSLAIIPPNCEAKKNPTTRGHIQEPGFRAADRHCTTKSSLAVR
jgi:hypothetical protein